MGNCTIRDDGGHGFFYELDHEQKIEIVMRKEIDTMNSILSVKDDGRAETGDCADMMMDFFK